MTQQPAGISWPLRIPGNKITSTLRLQFQPRILDTISLRRHRSQGKLTKFSALVLLQQFADTGHKFLAGVSPHDFVCDIGFRAGNLRAFRPQRWPELNLPGGTLMKVRRQLDPPPFRPPHATRVSRSEKGIHEISATAPPPTAISTLEKLLLPFLLEATPTCTLVSAISAGDEPPLFPSPLVAEHGPGLSSGIATVDGASFTTRIEVHSGPCACSRYGLVALLDTDSPQTFISAEAWPPMKYSNAASGICKRHAPPRSWRGSGKSAPLLTSTCLRLNIQFWNGSTPSAVLAVWACIVLIVLCNTPFFWGATAGSDSSSVRTPPCPHLPSTPTFGDLSLTTPYTDGLSMLEIFRLNY